MNQLRLKLFQCYYIDSLLKNTDLQLILNMHFAVNNLYVMSVPKD